MKNYDIGWLGEIKAAHYLRRQGMHILARRYRGGRGEIDLIAKDGDTLVFVEVKARPQGHIGDGARAVTAEKRARLRSAAEHYLLSHPWKSVRFDVVEISAAGLRHIKHAF
ncbi:MAG: YraN family protein [Clostridia bacterium]|nr:YraN family protein [Clostridia bacterium]